MPLMGWDAFCEAHHRPFLICAQLAQRAPHRFEPFRRYIVSLKLRGNFTFCQSGTLFRAVFESEKDALEIARSMKAKKVGRGDDWAGEWVFVLNDAATAKIISARRMPQRKSADRPLQRLSYSHIVVARRDAVRFSIIERSKGAFDDGHRVRPRWF